MFWPAPVFSARLRVVLAPLAEYWGLIGSGWGSCAAHGYGDSTGAVVTRVGFARDGLDTGPIVIRPITRRGVQISRLIATFRRGKAAHVVRIYFLIVRIDRHIG